jgi:hypothetical protein
MLAMDTDGDDMAVVHDSSTLLLNYYRRCHSLRRDYRSNLEHDILEFGSVNPGGGGGGGRVEEGGQGELASILYRKDEVRVQLSFRVLVGYVRF